LAGYAPQHPALTPDDLKSVDLSVCGIISYYGPADLLVAYDSFAVAQFAGQPPVPIGNDTGYKKKKGDAGRTDILLGGHPQDIPDLYQLASPITHIRPGCPPTLLIQGEEDFLVPVDATLEFYTKLVAAGVPAINVVIPWTDHAFDLVLPQINPAAQSALYDVDRFLALLLKNHT
jgi:acetyl esterase/lipase